MPSLHHLQNVNDINDHAINAPSALVELENNLILNLIENILNGSHYEQWSLVPSQSTLIKG